MTRCRYSIAVALALAALAGCEQLKSPQRLNDLESKVDQLTKDVGALKAKAGLPVTPPPRAGSGSAAHADSGSAVAEGEHAGSGEQVGSGEKAGSAAEHAGSDEHAEAAAPAAEAKPEAPAAGSGSEAEPAAAAAAGAPPDAGLDPDSQEARLARLRALVAKTTGPKLDADGRPRWSYDGNSGPAKWAAMDPAWAACGGKAQSPIDIEPRAGTASPISFHYKPTGATVVDDGRSLAVKLEPGSTIELDGKSYALIQLHFHMPSEHAIAGEHYPLEVQLLHQDASGKLAMISVLYDDGGDSKPLGSVWAAWPRIGRGAVLHKLDPSALLPETRTVFRYTGSLTQPPCTEGVVWNVMRRTMADSKAHLDAFGHHYSHSARDVQPRNDRQIL